jgi:hypothetical protein
MGLAASQPNEKPRTITFDPKVKRRNLNVNTGIIYESYKPLKKNTQTHKRKRTEAGNAIARSLAEMARLRGEAELRADALRFAEGEGLRLAANAEMKRLALGKYKRTTRRINRNNEIKSE